MNFSRASGHARQSWVRVVAGVLLVCLTGSALSAHGEKSDVNTLLKQLRDKKYFVRARAASALGDAGDLRAVGPLIGALRDPAPDVGRNAALALGKLRDPSAVGPLISVLSDSKSYRYNSNNL